MNACVVLQLAEAEAELDAMTKDRDELQLTVEKLEEKVTCQSTCHTAP